MSHKKELLRSLWVTTTPFQGCCWVAWPLCQDGYVADKAAGSGLEDLLTQSPDHKPSRLHPRTPDLPKSLNTA